MKCHVATLDVKKGSQFSTCAARILLRLKQRLYKADLIDNEGGTLSHVVVQKIYLPPSHQKDIPLVDSSQPN